MQLQAHSQAACGRLERSSRRAVASVWCSASSARASQLGSSSNVSRSPLSLSRPLRRASLAQPARQSIRVCQSVPNGKLISSTEVPSFIPRDDMIDQLYRWTLMEGGESGQRNFGLPMKVEPVYFEEKLWGFNVSIFKEGTRLTDVGVMFDKVVLTKHEWVGRGEDGFPVMEGKKDDVRGKNIEIWKMDSEPVTEDLRSTIRAYCTGLVAALNRYYAFGSVFVDDSQ